MKRILTFILFAFILLAQPAQATLIWYSNMDGTADPLVPNVGATTCAFVNSPTGGATGKFGTAFDFDAGTADYLACGSSHITSTDDWAVAAWVKVESSAAYRGVVTSGDDDGAATSGFYLYVTSADKVACTAVVGTNSAGAATSTASIDETGAVWVHIGCKKVGTALTTWINGAPDGSATLSSTTMDYTGDGVVFRVGAFVNGAVSTFLGQIDEVRVYDADVDMATVYTINPSRRSQVIIFQ